MNDETTMRKPSDQSLGPCPCGCHVQHPGIHCLQCAPMPGAVEMLVPRCHGPMANMEHAAGYLCHGCGACVAYETVARAQQQGFSLVRAQGERAGKHGAQTIEALRAVVPESIAQEALEVLTIIATRGECAVGLNRLGLIDRVVDVLKKAGRL